MYEKRRRHSFSSFSSFSSFFFFFPFLMGRYVPTLQCSVPALSILHPFNSYFLFDFVGEERIGEEEKRKKIYLNQWVHNNFGHGTSTNIAKTYKQDRRLNTCVLLLFLCMWETLRANQKKNTPLWSSRIEIFVKGSSCSLCVLAYRRIWFLRFTKKRNLSTAGHISWNSVSLIVYCKFIIAFNTLPRLKLTQIPRIQNPNLPTLFTSILSLSQLTFSSLERDGTCRICVITWICISWTRSFCCSWTRSFCISMYAHFLCFSLLLYSIGVRCIVCVVCVCVCVYVCMYVYYFFIDTNHPYEDAEPTPDEFDAQSVVGGRLISVERPLAEDGTPLPSRFCSNKTTTTKYKWWTFPFLNLYEQFRR